MDETTFLNELLAVKNRVAEMAFTFNCSPRPHFSKNHDLFSDRLEDVKAHLQAMQTSLLSMGQSQNILPRTASSYHMYQPATLPSVPSMPSALPSGPLFWQLFNSLRVDVRGLNERVSAVEREVSDLEDRFDNMRVDPFTPPGSDDMNLKMPTHPEYFGSRQLNEHSARYYQRYDGPQATPHRQAQYRESPSHSTGPMPAEHGASDYPAPEGVAFRGREIVALEDRVRDLQESLRYNEDLAAERNDTIADLYQRLRSCSNVMAHHNDEQTKYRALLENHDNAMQTLASSMATNHDLAMRDLSSKSRQRNQELEQHIRHLQRSLHESTVDKQDDSDAKSAETHRARQRLREAAARDKLITMQQQGILTREADIEEFNNDKTRPFRDLCNSQEVDRNKQTEQNTGAKLLIGRLTREISKLQASYRSEQREREHCANLLAEKTEEAIELRKALRQALTPNLYYDGRATSGQRPEQVEARNGSAVFPSAAPLSRLSSSKQWTPQPLPQSSELPAEVRRANLWDFGNPVAGNSPSFDTPSQIKLPAFETVGRGIRQDNGPQLLETLSAEDGQRGSAATPNRHSFQRSSHTNEHAGRHGPTARTTNSVVDMRSCNGDRLYQRYTGSRPQIGQNTTRKYNLQAYVEAEECGSGEQRDDVA